MSRLIEFYSATQILGSNLCVGERQSPFAIDRELAPLVAAGDPGAVLYGASFKADYRSYNGRFI